jgi:hypothetical protein
MLSIYRILHILLASIKPSLYTYQDIVTVAVLAPLLHLLRVLVGAELGPLYSRKFATRYS